METTRDIVIKVQAQQGRLVSELESEKKVRADTNTVLFQKIDSINAHLHRQDLKFAAAAGMLLLLQVLNSFGVFDRYKPDKHDKPLITTQYEKVPFNR